MRYRNYGFKSDQEFKKTICEAYNSGLSQKQIAEKIGCSRHTIIKAFKYFEIKSEVAGIHSRGIILYSTPWTSVFPGTNDTIPVSNK